MKQNKTKQKYDPTAGSNHAPKTPQASDLSISIELQLTQIGRTVVKL